MAIGVELIMGDLRAPVEMYVCKMNGDQTNNADNAENLWITLMKFVCIMIFVKRDLKSIKLDQVYARIAIF